MPQQFVWFVGGRRGGEKLFPPTQTYFSLSFSGKAVAFLFFRREKKVVPLHREDFVCAERQNCRLYPFHPTHTHTKKKSFLVGEKGEERPNVKCRLQIKGKKEMKLANRKFSFSPPTGPTNPTWIVQENCTPRKDLFLSPCDLVRTSVANSQQEEYAKFSSRICYDLWLYLV